MFIVTEYAALIENRYFSLIICQEIFSEEHTDICFHLIKHAIST